MLKLLSKPATTAPMPTSMLAETSPTYAALEAKIAALVVEETALRAEDRELAVQIFKLGGGHPLKSREHQSNVVAELGALAPPVTSPDMTRRRAIHQRLEVIEESIHLARAALSDERIRASAVICERVAGDHAALVTGICQALIELHRAAAKYVKFADNLNADRIAWSGLGASFLVLDPKDHPVGFPNQNNPISRYLREAVRLGHFPLADVPEELRYA